jgi:UDP:flavonoid glycosyltransferase YjiC (YdhE family)
VHVSLYPYLNNLGHTVPSLAIAQQLRARGHAVSFRGDGTFASLVTAAGFPLAPVFTFSDEYDRDHERWMSQWQPRVIERALDAELEAMDADRPDVVVADFRPTLCLAARIRGITVASILCADWTNYYEYPASLPPIPALGETASRAFAWFLMPWAQRAVLWWAARHLRGAYRRAAIRIHGSGNLFDTWTGTLNLLCDVPELAPLRPGAPEAFQYVGPQLVPLPVQRPPALDRLDPHRDLIYVTLGSSGINLGDRSVEHLCHAFEGRPEQIVITTGGQCPIPSGLPEHVIAVGLADGQELVRRARLVVCAGGSGGVYQALAEGVPLVLAPRNHNQWYVSERVQRCGAGRIVDRTLAPREFGRRVCAALDDATLAVQARRLKERIAKLVHEKRAAPLIERLC